MADYFGYFTGNLSDNELEWDNYPQQGYSSAFDNETYHGCQLWLTLVD